MKPNTEKKKKIAYLASYACYKAICNGVWLSRERELFWRVSQKFAAVCMEDLMRGLLGGLLVVV